MRQRKTGYAANTERTAILWTAKKRYKSCWNTSQMSRYMTCLYILNRIYIASHPLKRALRKVPKNVDHAFPLAVAASDGFFFFTFFAFVTEKIVDGHAEKIGDP